MHSRLGNLWYKLRWLLNTFFFSPILTAEGFLQNLKRFQSDQSKKPHRVSLPLQACGWEWLSQSRNHISCARCWCTFPQSVVTTTGLLLFGPAAEGCSSLENTGWCRTPDLCQNKWSWAQTHWQRWYHVDSHHSDEAWVLVRGGYSGELSTGPPVGLAPPPARGRTHQPPVG